MKKVLAIIIAAFLSANVCAQNNSLKTQAQACDKGDSQSCFAVGGQLYNMYCMIIMYGKSPYSKEAKDASVLTKKYLKKGCSLKHSDSCQAYRQFIAFENELKKGKHYRAR